MKAYGFLFALLVFFASTPGFLLLKPKTTGNKFFQASSAGSFSAFLPIVSSARSSQTPAPGSGAVSVMGVEASLSFGVNDMPEADTDWVRLNGVRWSDVEPNRGERNWAALSNYEPEWQSIAAMGKSLILVIGSTPAWAQKIPGSSCGPMKPAEIPAFARFMHDLVARYSAPPYSIKYWEIWNEPDVESNLISGDSPFGCWGDDSDPYYGGGYYAEMLKAVYPAIKAADPQARVITGGLLLDCNPNIPGACGRVEKELPPKFLIGVLRNGGGRFFDGVGFHAYDRCGRLGQYSNTGWVSSWNTTGPVIIAKARYIKEILSEFEVSGKFLINTESALMNPREQCDASFETSKVYYVPQLYAATIAEGVKASIWYSLQMDWRQVALFDAYGQPRPSYTAFSVAWEKFRNASYSKEINIGSGVKGYEFNRSDHKLWVLWSIDGNSHTLDVPGEVIEVTDVFGKPEPADRTEVTVTIKPIYVEWRQ